MDVAVIEGKCKIIFNIFSTASLKMYFQKQMFLDKKIQVASLLYNFVRISFFNKLLQLCIEDLCAAIIDSLARWI